MDTTAEPPSNSLGLELDALNIQDNSEQSDAPNSLPPDSADAKPAAPESADAPKDDVVEIAASHDTPPKSDAQTPTDVKDKEKKTPYVNPERVKTGGVQRDKLSEDELVERMARIREQNEKIKQRRIDVQADEDAFRKTQEAERIKVAKTKKVQENIDRTREQNARRKMEKMQNREWDSGKQTRDWKPTMPSGEEAHESQTPQMEIRGAVRGGAARGGQARGGPARGGPARGGPARGGGGRGRGRGKAAEANSTDKADAPAPAVA